MIVERTDGGTIIIKDIAGDMGQNTRLTLLQQPDGDVIISIYTLPDFSGISNSIEFCSSSGGGRFPIIAQKVREIIKALIEQK